MSRPTRSSFIQPLGSDWIAAFQEWRSFFHRKTGIEWAIRLDKDLVDELHRQRTHNINGGLSPEKPFYRYYPPAKTEPRGDLPQKTRAEKMQEIAAHEEAHISHDAEIVQLMPSTERAEDHKAKLASIIGAQA